mgnify:CR=1 FL=1
MNETVVSPLGVTKKSVPSPFSSFGKEENGVTIVYYCLVHSFAVFRNLMMEENNKLKNITMTIMLFL